VYWPPDHPLLTDPALAPFREAADNLCERAEIIRVLRYLPGRRVTTLVHTAGEDAILKVYSSPRARGGHRRLKAFAITDAAELVPRSLGCDRGHVGLIEFVHGTPLSDLPEDGLSDATRLVGAALRRLHESSAVLDRRWTSEDEIAQLRKTAGDQTRAAIDVFVRNTPPPSTTTLVPSHRDCYPAQAVLSAAGIRFIDLDDCAMAPRALDVGNFMAHLARDGVMGAGSASMVEDAFLQGYGEVSSDVEWWKLASLARLAALAETRHRRPEEMRLLMALLV
jgi:Ser/Thr protein kinase RdoA (MazF antagonist)